MCAIGNLKVMIRASVLALIVFLLQASSCAKEEKEFIEVLLRMPVTISPPQKSISLRDTLWLNFDFPDTLEDYLSGKHYKVVGYDFFTSIMFIKLIGPTIDQGDQPAAAGNFNFYPKIGSFINIGSLGGDIKFEYSNSRYRAKVGLVAKQKGVYSLIMLFRGGSEKLSGIVDPILDGKNRGYFMNKINYILNDGNFHFDLYKENCLVPPQLIADPIEFKDFFNTYTFEVK